MVNLSAVLLLHDNLCMGWMCAGGLDSEYLTLRYTEAGNLLFRVFSLLV